MPAHSLILEPRGLNSNRWKPHCTCGKWAGKTRRRRGRAETDYVGHIRSETRTATRSKKPSYPAPRPVTPAADLPQELRPRP